MLAALGIAKCKSFAPEVDARKLLDLAANSIHNGTSPRRRPLCPIDYDIRIGTGGTCSRARTGNLLRRHLQLH